MATVVKYSGAAAVPFDGTRKDFQVYELITCAATDIVDANVLQLLNIPENSRVKSVRVKIVTPAVVGTSLVMNIGITGGTTNGFDASVNLTASAGTITQSTPSDTYPAAGGYFVSTSDTVDGLLALVGAVTTAPVFKIWACCESFSE
jgi:hypothetical protein